MRRLTVRLLLVTLLLRVLYSGLAALFLRIPTPGEAARIATNFSLPKFTNGWQLWLLEPWQRFDTVWYLQIAQSGYPEAKFTVFYPLYPLLISALSALLQPTLAALVISTIAAFFFFWAFHKLAAHQYGNKAAWLGLLLFCVWPSGSILFAGYPESLLLALMAWSIWFGSQQRLLLAATLGLLAGFTKATGALVAIPLLYLAMQQKQYRQYATALLPFLAYPSWQLWIASRGFPAASNAYLQYWRTSVTWPWLTLMDGIREFLSSHSWLLGANIAAILVVLAASFYLRRGYAAFCLSVVAFFLLKHTDPILQSSIRYCMVAFPVFTLPAPKLGIAIVPVGFFLGLLNLFFLFLFVHWSLVL